MRRRLWEKGYWEIQWEKGCSEGDEKGTVGEGCGGVVVRRKQWGGEPYDDGNEKRTVH